ncbi:MAG: hypothetical protein B0D91_13225 [Oceanospirillales bacterium LUC14_002_19_P2]|nr:MAG: hypothetical protein B0D91_13225 [Oceanospirillales bacterium LUC14_002_19_P2]
MKSITQSLLVAGAISLSSFTLADYTGPGAGGEPTSVAAINKAPKDDMYVVLEGKLLQKKKHETYIFSDGTGEIPVEIDDRLMPAQNINEKSVIEIQGEVDAGVMETPEIDVKEIRVIKP